MAHHGITRKSEAARARGVRKGDGRAVEIRGREAAAVAMVAIVAGRPAVEWNRQICAAVGHRPPSELLADDVPRVNLSTGKAHGRKEFSIRKLRQAFAAPAHADIRLDLVVVRLDVAIRNRPVLAVTVAGRRLELEVRIAIADSSPAKGFATHLAAANPHERLVGVKRVRMLGIVNEEMVIVLIDGVAQSLHRLLLEEGLGIAKSPKAKTIGPHMLCEIMLRGARGTRLQHQHFGALFAEDFGHPAAARSGADDNGVVNLRGFPHQTRPVKTTTLTQAGARAHGGSGNLSHIAIAVVGYRCVEIHMVEEIEEITAKLQTQALTQKEILVQTHIDIYKAWPENVVAAGVAVTAGWHIHVKRVEVEPLPGRLWSIVGILPRHDVRTQGTRIAVVAEAGIVHAERSEPKAGLYGPYPVKLPAANHRIQKSRRARTKLAASAERQIVDAAQDETVADIEVGVPVLPVLVTGVAEGVAGVRAAQIGVRRIIKSVAVGVRSQERKTAGQAFLQLHKQSVVARKSIIIGLLRSVLQVRIGQARGEVVKRRSRIRLVEIDEGVQVMPGGTAVAGFEGEIFSEDALEGDIPLLDARSMQMGWQAGDLKLCIRVGERIQRKSGMQRLVRRTVDHVERRIVTQAGITPGTDLLKTVVNAEPTPQDRLRVERIGEAEPWRPIVLVSLNQARRSIGIHGNSLEAGRKSIVLPGGQDKNTAIEVEVRLPVVALRDGREVFEAQAKIQR